MGKRSSFERREGDRWATPREAVEPLLPHLTGIKTFAEPCCGDGDLVRHLEDAGLRCPWSSDISGGQDALDIDDFGPVDAIITNPPYTRKVMHAMIDHFSTIAPTWLLIEFDWTATQQAQPFMPLCSHIVIVGRLRWMPGTKNKGKENFAWCRFDATHTGDTIFLNQGRRRNDS